MSLAIFPSALWHVVQTQPNAERKAAAHLARQNFETYLPCYPKRRRHARRAEIVRAPLFPRYLFVSIDISAQRWRSIQSTVGVSRLVCNGDEPAPVPYDVVGELRRREDEGGLIHIDRPRFTPGDKVRVVDGAFYDCFGLFETVSDSERVSILLDLLGRKVRVTLDVEDVVAA